MKRGTVAYLPTAMYLIVSVPRGQTQRLSSVKEEREVGGALPYVALTFSNHSGSTSIAVVRASGDHATLPRSGGRFCTGTPKKYRSGPSTTNLRPVTRVATTKDVPREAK